VTTTTTNPRGDWILTRSGVHFHPLDPRPAEVRLNDIAYSLANQCRWTGHVRHHYSIAQHAVLVAQVVEAAMPGLALAALHHDSAEAYIGDIARPWKRMLMVRHVTTRPDGSPMLGTMGSVDAAEAIILENIYEALGIDDPGAEAWRTIMLIDNRVLRTEFEQLLPADDAPGWALMGDAIPGLLIEPITPTMAADLFLGMHYRLVGASMSGVGMMPIAGDPS
jgi:uncharacterized protein